MISRWRAPRVIAAILAIACSAIGADSAKQTLVEFWHVRDDVLSERLADQVESAFQRSPDFTMSSGKKPGTLVVRVPTNIDWRRRRAALGCTTQVNFTLIDNQRIGSSQGSCWETALAECAAQIVRRASIAARKIR